MITPSAAGEKKTGPITTDVTGKTGRRDSKQMLNEIVGRCPPFFFVCGDL
jgi:hypothetical protein